MPSDRTHNGDSDYDGSDHGASSTNKKVGNPLQRGSACLNCRKRKMKCDATKPVCRQCVKANRQDECDYDDGRQKSRTQILKEKIAKLEDRIRELEREEDEMNAASEMLELNAGIDVHGSAVGPSDSSFEYDSAPIPLDPRDLRLDLSSTDFDYGQLDLNSFAYGSHTPYRPPTSHVQTQSDHLGFDPIGLAHASTSTDPASFGFQGSGQMSALDSMYAAALGSGVVAYDTNVLGAMGVGAFDLIGPVNNMGGVASDLDPMSNVFAPITSSYTTTSYQQESAAGTFSANHASSSAHAASGVGTSNFQGRSLGSPFGKSSVKQPKNRWDVDNLPVAERSLLAEVFLPHSQQCGLDLSSKRFRQRMGVDVLANPTSQRSDDSPPLAHAALANAIFLLACHFASTSELPRGHALQHLRPDTIKKELADAEPGFLTRALRGIAAALEAGEAAAIASTSSGSERASLRSSSSSQSIGRSRPGTASPLSRRSASRSPTFGSAAGLQPEGYSDPATPLVDAVQASALLAVYFFAKARLLEGYYHSSAAARLAVSLGMHQIKTAVWTPPQPSPLLNSDAFQPHLQNRGVSSISPTLTSAPTVYSSTWQPTPITSTPISYLSAPASLGVVPSASSRFGRATSSVSSSFSPAVLLPPARDASTHRERVSAFWTVFIIDRCWSVATGLPSSLPDDDHPQLKISSVWPWEEGVIPTRSSADFSSLSIMFGGNASSGELAKGTVKGLKARAAAVFERAARISSMETEPTYWEQFTQLQQKIDSFSFALPPYVKPSPFPTEDRVDVDMALVHTLAYAAVIQLHHPQAQKDAHAHATCVLAASRAMRIVRALVCEQDSERRISKRFIFLDPVIGTCWMCVADVLLRERGWGRNMEAAIAGSTLGESNADVHGVNEELEVIVGALRRLSVVFPVAQYQVQKVQQSLHSS